MITHNPDTWVGGLPSVMPLYINDMAVPDIYWSPVNLNNIDYDHLNLAIAQRLEEDDVLGAERGYIMISAMMVYQGWWNGIRGQRGQRQ